jgi:hypothetical protein
MEGTTMTRWNTFSDTRMREFVSGKGSYIYQEDAQAALDEIDRLHDVVDRACAAVCHECARGKKAKHIEGYGERIMHLFPGYPPRECKAARIRNEFGGLA